MNAESGRRGVRPRPRSLTLWRHPAPQKEEGPLRLDHPTQANTGKVNRNSHRNARLAAAVGAGLAAIAAASAHADTPYTWTPDTTGNFSGAGSWSSGAVPTGTSVNDNLVFGGSTSYVATLDNDPSVLPGFYFNSITFNNSAGMPSIQPLFPTAVGGLHLRVADPNGSTINLNGAGDANIATPINVARGSTLTVNVAAGAGTLSLANFNNGTALSGYALYGDGNVHFVNNSSNAILVGDFGVLRGDVYVDAGTVVEADSATNSYYGVSGAGAGDVIASNNILHVAAGATFDMNANGESMGGIAGAGTIRLGASGGMTLMYRGNLEYSGIVTGPTDGTVTSGGLSKDDSSGNTVYTFDGGNSTFNGTTTDSSGTMVLSGGAQFSASKQLTVNNGSTFTMDNSSQNVVNRFNTAATVSLAGTMNLIGAPGAVSSQQFTGNFTIGTNGPSAINIVNGANGGSASITANNLLRGGRGSYVDFSGNGTFSSATAAPLTNGIVGFATVNGSDWATVNTANGNQIVAYTGYNTNADPTTWATTDNVQNDGTAVAIGASQTVNSLKFTGPAALSIASGATLKLSAGGILALNGGEIDGPGNIVAGQSSNAEVLFAVQGATNTLTVNANITNSPANGVLKVGPGTLVLNGNNTYSGNTRIWGGTLAVSTDANLGGNASGTSIIMAGGTLRFLQPGFTSNRSIQMNGPYNVIDTNGNDVTFSGFISGNGDVTKTGLGNFILSGTNGRFVSGGFLHIAQGGFTTGQGDTFGNSNIITIDKGAYLDLSYDTSGEDLGGFEGAGQVRTVVNGGVTYESGDRSEIVFSGTIDPYANGVQQSAGGALTKNAQGDLQLSGASTYTGATTINRGSITIMADALPNTPGPLGNSSTALLLGSTAVNNYDSAFYIGAAGVTMGRDVTVQGFVNSFGGPNGIVTLGVTHTSGTTAFTGAITTDRPLEIAVPTGAATQFTGVISGLGSFTLVGGGTVTISGNNGLQGGVSVNNGTLAVSSDANLGGSSAALNLNGGTLQTSAGFTTSRTINIGTGGATISNTDATTPLVLNGTLNAAGRLTKAADGGTLQLAQGGPVTLPGLTVNGGTVNVATGGMLTLTDTLSGAGTLAVNDGVSVNLGATATPVAHAIGTLNLNNTGTVDLGKNSLLTASGNVASYVARAAGPVQPNGLNAWTGSGLTSSLVQADAATGNTKQLAVGYFDSRDNANTGLSVPAGQTLVKETVYGDATGDGKVNIADLSVWNNNFGVSSPRWSQGDFNYDGKVNIADLSVWNNNFGGHLSGPTPPPAGAVAAASSVKLTSASASTSAEAATPPAGTLELDIDPSTGDAKLNSGGLGVAAIEIDSASGVLLPAGWKSLKNNYGYTQWAFPRGTPNASQIAEFVSDPSPGGQPANLAAGTVIDYGDIFPVGFTNVADLTFSYNLITDPAQGLTATRTGVIVVPEPTGLALAGVAAAGLLGRKRRRRRRA